MVGFNSGFKKALSKSLDSFKVKPQDIHLIASIAVLSSDKVQQIVCGRSKDETTKASAQIIPRSSLAIDTTKRKSGTNKSRSIKDTRPQRKSRARSDTRFHLLEEKANAYVTI